MEITYDYYRTFYYVAKYRSFSRAAEVLLKGQPNITKTVSNLENQLGCKLFVRSNRGAILTPEGEKLFMHVEIAFENIEKAENELLQTKNTKNGAICIAATEIALHCCLISALSKFKKDYKNVKIRLLNLNSPDALAAVKNGIADFAVVTLHENQSDFFDITKVTDFKEILCCEKSFEYDKNNPFDSPYISINRRSYTYDFYKKYLFDNKIYKEPDIEVATADQVLPLIKAGMGIGFVPLSFVQQYLNSGEVKKIELTNNPKPRGIYFVKNKKPNLSAITEIFKKYLV